MSQTIIVPVNAPEGEELVALLEAFVRKLEEIEARLSRVEETVDGLA